ncbi:MAG TPA: hypothetical protein VJ553_07155 [Candidatus Paceibacterota bacterium]|nr:hypothetical protein [Candidatus Paceibacterota bacterium]
MQISKDVLKSIVRPKIISILKEMDGRATINGELISRSECAIIILALFRQNFERSYAEAAQQLGEHAWLHGMLPIVMREICEEERARGAQ